MGYYEPNIPIGYNNIPRSAMVSPLPQAVDPAGVYAPGNGPGLRTTPRFSVPGYGADGDQTNAWWMNPGFVLAAVGIVYLLFFRR